MLHFRHDNTVYAPFAAVFQRTPPLMDFALSLKWSSLSQQAAALATLGDTEGWPHTFLKAKPAGFWVGVHRPGAQSGNEWKVIAVELDTARSWHRVQVNCFGGLFKVYLNGIDVGELEWTRPTETWSFGPSPYMQGSGVYGEATLSNIELRAVPYGTRGSGDDNVLLNFAVLDAFEADVEERTNPALLKIDVDDLTAYRVAKGWPNANDQIDALYALVKRTAVAHSTGRAARSHYKGKANDELVVLCDAGEAHALAEAILHEVRETALPGCGKGDLKVSIGIGIGSKPFSVLYAMAGVGLLEAKKAGKDCMLTCRNLRAK